MYCITYKVQGVIKSPIAHSLARLLVENNLLTTMCCRNRHIIGDLLNIVSLKLHNAVWYPESLFGLEQGTLPKVTCKEVSKNCTQLIRNHNLFQTRYSITLQQCVNPNIRSFLYTLSKLEKGVWKVFYTLSLMRILSHSLSLSYSVFVALKILVKITDKE